MAIPVSMALPEEFEPANLENVPKHSIEQISRFQKNSLDRILKTGDPLSDSNLVLARAIQQLAEAISTNGYESMQAPASNGAASTNGGTNGSSRKTEGVPVLNGAEKTAAPQKIDRALPVGSPVLVRREAAAEAHRFQRTSQAATDIKGPQQSGFSKWIEKHPLAMMMTGLILLITLVVLTTILMNGALGTKEEELPTSTTIGAGNANDPDFEYAEKEARGFLNAISLNSAKPYIFRAAAIGPKLQKFFLPLPDPANYEVKLTGRQKHDNKAVYYYQVTSGDTTQPMVVLQEGNNFKVFWEFGACVGDISWKAFVDEEPTDPVLMRAFLKPEQVNDSIHDPEEWTSWRAENWDGSRSAMVFSKIGSPEDRRLRSALIEHPVNRKDTNWVMAQVRLKHVGTGIDRLAGAFESAEVVEVPLGSWLPEEFVTGSTFYSEEDRLKGPSKDIRGLQKRATDS